MDGLLTLVVLEEFPHRRVLDLWDQHVGGVRSRVDHALWGLTVVIQRPLLLWSQLDTVNGLPLP